MSVYTSVLIINLFRSLGATSVTNNGYIEYVDILTGKMCCKFRLLMWASFNWSVGSHSMRGVDGVIFVLASWKYDFIARKLGNYISIYELKNADVLKRAFVML